MMRREDGRRAWRLLLAAWAAVATVLAGWLALTPTGDLREQLKGMQFWSLDACLLALGLALLAVAGELRRRVDRVDAAWLAVIASLAVGLTLTMPPRINRIYYDEQIYQSIGRNLSDIRLAQVCNDGSVESGRLQCLAGEYNKQPYAYPHLLGVMYRAFGVHEITAFVLNALAMAVCACGIYLLLRLLFDDREAAVFAGLVLSFTPEQLMWSATAAVEPWASASAVVALVMAAQFARSGSRAALAATTIAAAYAVQFRPESVLVLPIVALIAWKRIMHSRHEPVLWWAALGFVVLTSVHIAHLFAVRDAPWGTNEARFSWRYVRENLRVNGWFYLWDERFPFVFTWLALAGVAGRRYLRARLALVLFFVLFFAIDLIFYAGSYNYGADVRYSLLTYPPLAALAGLGAARGARLLQRLATPVMARTAMIAALTFDFLLYAPAVRAMPDEAWAARADVAFARDVSVSLPPHSYVLTHNPGMFHLWGINAGQMSRVADNPAFTRYLVEHYEGGVFVHWNFWCNVQDAVQPEFCRKALAQGATTLVREARERDQRYAFYRLRLSTP